MRILLTKIEPVAIALDRIDVHGNVVFTGDDLETGTQVTVHIERKPKGAVLNTASTREAHGLVLVLTMHFLLGDQ